MQRTAATLCALLLAAGCSDASQAKPGAGGGSGGAGAGASSGAGGGAGTGAAGGGGGGGASGNAGGAGDGGSGGQVLTPDPDEPPDVLRPITTIAMVDPTRWPTPRRPYTTAAGGTVLHVAPGGADSGDGSLERPFKTIKKAVATARSGDIVRVAAGTYTLTASDTFGLELDKDNVVLTARRGERVVLRAGGGTVAGVRITGDDVVFDGFELEGFSDVGIMFGRTDRTQRGVQILRTKVTGGTDSIRSVVPGSRGMALIDGLLVYDTEIAMPGLIGFNCGEGPCNGVRLERVTVHGRGSSGGNTAADAIAFEDGANLAVVDSEVTNVEGDGVDTKADGVVVLNVRAHDLGRNGIKLWRGGDVMNSLVANTGADAAIVFDNPGAYRILNTTVVRHSPGANAFSVTAAYDMRGPGTLTIQNSIFSRNSGSIFAPSQFTVVLENNLFFGTESGFEFTWGDMQFGGGDNALSALRGAADNLQGMDPRFADTAGGDYTLMAGSPAIDRGRAVPQMPDVDLAGNPRSAGGGVDLGCYERP